jgi:hypothetical protein
MFDRICITGTAAWRAGALAGAIAALLLGPANIDIRLSGVSPMHFGMVDAAEARLGVRPNTHLYLHRRHHQHHNPPVHHPNIR